MKNVFFSSARVNYHPNPQLNKLFAILICLIFSNNALFCQYFTRLYKPVAGYDFDNHESYILQKFTPSSNYTFDGTIMVQTVTTATNEAIQITLVDEKGVFQKAFTIFEGTNLGDYVPTCAAYNSSIHEYCIAGIHNSITSPTGDMEGWFLFLDVDLNVINGYTSGLDLSAAGIGPSANMFVTDVTSMEGIAPAGLGDFAYVGVGGNAGDPTPVSVATTVQKQMCIGYASSAGIGSGVTYDLTDPALLLAPNEENNMYFPSRIVELPIGGTYGGFMVCGVGAIDQSTSFPSHTTFFLRTDYQFGTPATTPNNNIELYSSANTHEKLYASDLYYDNAQK